VPGSRQDADVAVVGAGIVGLAVARELLLRDPGRDVAVVEREHAVGTGQTGRNSGVVHAGIYYAPASLKARLCVRGGALLEAFCGEHGVPFARPGKLVVAVDAAELPRLDELERRGRANGVPGLRRVSGAELREIEPHARGVAALHSPATGVADFAAVARALAADVQRRGGRLLLGREVTAVEPGDRAAPARGPARPPGPVLDGPTLLPVAGGPPLRAGRAVFCVGMQAHRLAVAAGAPADPRIVPFLGRYLRLAPHARDLVRSLIYPVPDPRLPFLGVHLTRGIDGQVDLGPGALLAGGLAWPGTWRVLRRHWHAGLRELRLAAGRRAFVAAGARYVPELRERDVADGWSGVRAQAVARDGTLLDDFAFSEAAGTLHVRNAPSPAATSALAIAEVVADRLFAQRAGSS
jgi:2-hydroxyglutarate dehydrogenase